MQNTVESMLLAYESARVKIETHVAAYDQWRRYLTDATIVTSLNDSVLIDHCATAYDLEPLVPLLETLRLTMRSLLGKLGQSTIQNELSDHVERIHKAHHVLIARCNEIQKDGSWAQTKPIHEIARSITACLHSITSALTTTTAMSGAIQECENRRATLNVHIATCAHQFFELERVLWSCNWSQSVVAFEKRADVAHAIHQQAMMINRRISSHNDAHTRHCVDAERQRVDERARLRGMVDAYAQQTSSLRATLEALSIKSAIVPTASSLRALIPQCVHTHIISHPFHTESMAYVEIECKKQLYYKQMMDGRRSMLQSIVHDVTTIEFTGSLWKVHSDLRLLEHRVRTIQWSTARHLDSPSHQVLLWNFYKRMMVELSRKLNERLDCEYRGRICDARIHSVVDYKRALYTTVSQVVTMCQTMRQIDGLVLSGHQDRVLCNYRGLLDALHSSESSFIQDRIQQCIRRHSDYTNRIRQTERSHLDPTQASIQRLHVEKSDIQQSRLTVDLLITECERAISISDIRLGELVVLVGDMERRHASPLEVEAYQVEIATLSAYIRDMRAQISKNQVERETLTRAASGADGLCARLYTDLQRIQRQVDVMHDAQLEMRKQHDLLLHTQSINCNLFERITHRVSDALGCIALPRVVLPIETPLFASTSDNLSVYVTVENTANLTSIIAEVVSMRIWHMANGRWVRQKANHELPSRIRHYHHGTHGEIKTFRFPFCIGYTHSCRVECSIVARLNVKTDAGSKQVTHSHSLVQHRIETPLSLWGGAASVVLLVVLLTTAVARCTRPRGSCSNT